MISLDPSESVLSIKRSQTIDAMGNTSENSNQPKSNPRLQRISSNSNFDANRRQTAAPPPGVGLERSHSLDTGMLGEQLKRSLSLNEVRLHTEDLGSPVPQQGTQTPPTYVQQTQQNIPTFTEGYQMYPPSPYLPPQGFTYDHQQQHQTANNVVNSLMTPLQTVPQSPNFRGVMFTPSNYAMSPMMSIYQPERNYFFSSPFAPPQTPMQMPTIHNFQLPVSGQPQQQHQQENIMRTVSMRNEANNYQQNQYYTTQNTRYEEKTSVERMLEELRLKMKGVSNMQHMRNNYNGNISHGQESLLSFGLKEIQGAAYMFAKDQFGSRFIQRQLEDENIPQEDKNNLFNELVPYLPALCKDVFGNYVIQKLLEIKVGTKEQHNLIYTTAVKGNMFELAKHMYGCRVIQKLVESVFGHTSNLTVPQTGLAVDDIYSINTQNNVLLELTDVRTLVTDQNGNHVIQKCISSIKPNDRLKMFYSSFRGNYTTMSKHPYGCRVVQRVLENADLAEIFDVIQEMQHHLHEMILNQYANYVVQHIIQHQKHLPTFSNSPSAIGSLVELEQRIVAHIKAFRTQLYEIVGANVLSYSKHKFGSNVVECSIKHGLPKERERVIKRILEPTCLIQMMQDQYANYVVQKVIDNATPSQKDGIIKVVQQHELTLRRLTFGKHIINKLKAQSYE